MKNIYQLILLIPLTFCLFACGGSDSNDKTSTAGSTPDGTARFGKDIGKGCEVLTAELVGKTFSVPAESLKQTAIMGCFYNWDNETDELQASIFMVRAHKSDTSAASWFANATRNRTAQEMKAEMEKVAARMNKSEKLDTDAKKSMANVILDSVALKAVNFEDVANVGDEARADADGSIFVRVDNLTFNVSAYQGLKQPPPAIAGLDIKQMIAVSKQHAQDWQNQTAPQRKQDGAKLAAAIVKTL